MSLAPTTSQVSESLNALLSGAGVATLDGSGWISVTGPDRVRWLNGMVTNNVAALMPGQGCYCFVLSAQGRIQADLHAFASADAILLETDRRRVPALIELLEKFLIMDEVELADEREHFSGVLIAGPRAAKILAAIGLDTTTLAPLKFVEVTWRGINVRLLHAESPLIPRYELWIAPAGSAALLSALIEAGAATAPQQALEQLRILEGTPVFGVDIRDRDLPQETGQSRRALHFSKGCYLGQEIVERIHSRGNLRRTFSAFNLQGDVPLLPSPLFVGEDREKAVGELTSCAQVNLHGELAILALGYIRRDALERTLPISYAGGVATAAPAPFRSSATVSNNHASQPVIA